MNQNNLRNWLTLVHTPKLGPVSIQQLLQHFETPENIISASATDLKQFLGEESIQYIQQPDQQKIDEELQWAEQEQASILCIDDPAYPELLKQLHDAPVVLYLFGKTKTLNQPQLAMVGSRNPSHSGLEIAHDFARYLASVGLTITSGMALGIDAASHQGALDSGQDISTIAVTGTGLDRVYPSRHRDLAYAIAEKGLLVSEYPLGTAPLPGNFPRRNRIISGLSMGVLVIEAALKSGSLITARQALDQGREVFAVPGSIHNPLAKGCHALIRDGAKLVEKAEHILEELGAFVGQFLAENGEQGIKNEQNEQNTLINIDSEYQQVLKCVDFEPTSVDKVVERCGLTANAVCSMLLVLELQGYVKALSGGYYCQNR